MTNNELINAIETANITDAVIDELINFEWEYDPYGIIDFFGGHIDDPGVRDRVRTEVIYRLNNEKDVLIDELRTA